MATNFPAFQQLAQQHRELLRQASVLNTLLGSPTDVMKFVCAVPPFEGAFAVELPRSVWGAIVQAKFDTMSTQAAALDAAAAAYLLKAP